MKTRSTLLAAAAVMLFAQSAAAQDAPPPAATGDTHPSPPPPATPERAHTTIPSPSTSTSLSTDTSVDPSALAKKEWYGGQIILADVIGYAFIGLGAGLGAGSESVGTYSLGIAGPGVAVYGFAGPVVHSLHANNTAGYKSLLLRMLLPAAVGGLAGVVGHIATGNDEKSPIRTSSGMFWGGTIGAGVGALAATIIDAALWARKDTTVHEGNPPATTAPPVGVRVAPSVAASPGGASAGLVGTF